MIIVFTYVLLKYFFIWWNSASAGFTPKPRKPAPPAAFRPPVVRGIVRGNGFYAILWKNRGRFMKLTEKQQELADKLPPRTLNFVNLWLTREKHGMTQGQCYEMAGYVVKNKNCAYVAANRLLRLPKVWAYIREMRRESCENVGLDLEYLDEQLRQILDATAPDVMSSFCMPTKYTDRETGEVIESHTPILRCAIDDLPPEIAAAIQSIKMTKNGPEIKMYSRTEALKLAYQRHGALVNKTELTGKDGGPIETKSLTDAELNARIERLLANTKT